MEGTTWTIPAARYKTKIDFELPLSHAALELLAAIPRIGKCALTASGATGSFARYKAKLHGLMLAELRQAAAECGDDPEKVTLERWTIHDLRRTTRSLMTRAGVLPDHAERALGHVIGGVRGVYDRHGYFEEKRRAFEALAAQVELVLNPQPNVVPMRRVSEADAVP